MIWIPLFLALAPPGLGTADGDLEVDRGAPVVLKSTVEIEDGWSPLIEWRHNIPLPGGVREFDDGNSLAVWAPPGTHEITLSIVLAKVEAEKIVFRKQTKVYRLKIRGPPENPPDPKEPVDPRPADAVHMIYESSQSRVPLHADAAAQELRKAGRQVRIIDVDARTGAGGVPREYAKSIPAAKRVGLPALVTLAAGEVVAALKLPATKADILKAVNP